MQRLARWIYECTAPDDRILVVGYYPEVTYYSERAFAGGTAFFHPPYFTDIVFQDRIVAQLRRERVALVIEESATRMLEDSYSHVGEYVREHFSLETETDFGGSRRFQILVNRSL